MKVLSKITQMFKKPLPAPLKVSNLSKDSTSREARPPRKWKRVLLYSLSAIGLLVFTYEFLARSYSVGGDPAEPFVKGQTVWSEKVTYLFREPKVGERVIFEPQPKYSYIGLITDIKTVGQITTYSVVSSNWDNPWVVSSDKITRRIYFPSLSGEQLRILIGSVSEDQKAAQVSKREIHPSAQIAFLKKTSGDTDRLELWLSGRESEQQKGTGVFASEIHQSPDFRYVLFQANRSGEGPEWYLLNLSSDEVTQVSSSYFPATEEYDGSSFGSAWWSPDGKRVLYHIGHSPSEWDERGIPIQKEAPPQEFWEKMGVFIYDIEHKQLTKLGDDPQDNLWEEEQQYWYGNVLWGPTGELLAVDDRCCYSLKNREFKEVYPRWGFFSLGSVFWRAFASNGDIYLSTRGSGEDEDSTFVTAEVMKYSPPYEKGESIYETPAPPMGNPPPLILSPDERFLAFPDFSSNLLVISTSDISSQRVFANSQIHGHWSDYKWISNEEIVFWCSCSGKEYTGQEWYYGNLKKLNVETSAVEDLTTDCRSYWQF